MIYRQHADTDAAEVVIGIKECYVDYGKKSLM